MGVAALAVLGVAGAGCGRARGVPAGAGPSSRTLTSEGGPELIELDLTRGLPEATSSPLFGIAARRTYTDLVLLLRSFSGAERPKGVLVRLGGAAIELAKAQEAGGLLEGLRGLGVPVVCHADDYGNGSLLFAAEACSSIWVSPAGGVDSVGIAAQLLYGHQLLERFKVSVDFLQVGKFKGAEEPFTRDGPSPEARESLLGALRGVRSAWLAGIARGRGQESAAEAAEDGPFAPEDAVRRGLADHVGYADEARDALKKETGGSRFVTRFGAAEGAEPVPRGLGELLRAVSGSGRGGAPHVTIVRAIGAISMSSSSPLPFGGGGEGITEHELGRTLARVTADPASKAIVLRIDSPGGSALASDLLWKKLMKLRSEKPLVVSVGGMAASGGYYLACTASKIVVEPTSIIGSIGVVGGKLAFGKTAEEVGVHAETLAASPDPIKAARAGYNSTFTPWDEPTRQKVLLSMTSVYDLFLRRVAEGRGVPVERIAPSAEGRVFGGVEAKERGLVDELGGLDDAIRLARELAKLPEDAPVELLGESGGGLLGLLEGEEEARAGATAAIAGEARRQALQALTAPLGEALPGLPPFVGSLGPLASGERVLAAVPFGLLVR